MATPARAPAARPISGATPLLSMDDFADFKQIGKGKDSVVYSATCAKLGGGGVVLKVYDKARISAIKHRSVRREARIMRFLTDTRVPHCCCYIGAFQDSKQIYIVMEHAAGGDLLEQLLREGRAMTEKRVVREVVVPILTALAHLHAAGVIHRDIKLENLFVSPSRGIVLGDFGLALCVHEEKPISPVGTLEYMPPEILRLPPTDLVLSGAVRAEDVSPVDEKVDQWSFGVTVYELVTGRSPFEGASKDEIRGNILRHDMRPLPAFLTPECTEWIGAAMTADPACRPSALQLLRHRWVIKNLAADEAARLLGMRLSTPRMLPSPSAAATGSAAAAAVGSAAAGSASTGSAPAAAAGRAVAAAGAPCAAAAPAGAEPMGAPAPVAPVQQPITAVPLAAAAAAAQGASQPPVGAAAEGKVAIEAAADAVTEAAGRATEVPVAAPMLACKVADKEEPSSAIGEAAGGIIRAYLPERGAAGAVGSVSGACSASGSALVGAGSSASSASTRSTGSTGGGTSVASLADSAASPAAGASPRPSPLGASAAKAAGDVEPAHGRKLQPRPEHQQQGGEDGRHRAQAEGPFEEGAVAVAALAAEHQQLAAASPDGLRQAVGPDPSKGESKGRKKKLLKWLGMTTGVGPSHGPT